MGEWLVLPGAAASEAAGGHHCQGAIIVHVQS